MLTILAIYLFIGLINCLILALVLTNDFVLKSECPKWKNRWIPVITLLWLPLLFLAIGIHLHSVLQKQS